MRLRTACGFALLLAPIVATGTPARAAVDDEERIAALERWQESPLDLLDAGIEQVALLPGLGVDVAEAVVGLRELGRLSELDDLLQVPGIGPPELAALRPYVRLGGRSPSAGIDLHVLTQGRSSADGASRQVAVATQGRWTLTAVQVSRAGGRLRRGAASLEVRGVRVTGGDLVLRGVGGVFDATPGRSRVAAAARPRTARVRPRTDSASAPGLRGVALEAPGAGWVFAGGDPDGEVLGAALELGPRTRHLGLSLRRGAGSSALGAVVGREGGRAQTWLGVVVEGASRSAWLAARTAGRRWRLGVDASATDGPLHHGDDPVSGHRLDRSHRAVQLHGRLRGQEWSVSALGRSLGRNGRTTTTLDLDLVWRPSPGTGPARVEFGLRALPEPQFASTAVFDGAGGRLRARYGYRATGSAAAEILGLDFERRAGPGRLALAAALVDGDGSRPWMLRRPGTGIYPVWLRPGEGIGALGLETGSAGLCIGLWAWVQSGADRSARAGGGISCRLRAGRLVRRLQGAGGRVRPHRARLDP